MENIKDAENSKKNIPESNPPEEEMNMADILGPEVQLEEGKVYQARVVGQNEDGFLVDLGIKSEGLILKAEFEPEAGASSLKVGDEIKVALVKLRSEYGHPLVSYKKILAKESWDKIAQALKEDSKITGTIKKKIKGGFLVDVGIDAFLPESQTDLKYVKDFNKYLGQKLEFLITEASKEKRNVVLSRRKLLEEESRKTRSELVSKLQEGEIVEGKVRSITKFGAFIDVGGMDGLVHISDLAWHHVKKVEDILKVGQSVSVKILKIDKQAGKISLGMKHLSPRPWDSAEERYPAGLVVKGKVKSVADFGVFLEIEPGLEGLIHESEISWTDTGSNHKKMFSPGQEVEAKIISLDVPNEKMALSIKRLKANPWEETFNNFPPGTKAKATITKIMPFGAFARINESMEGIIKVSDISWEKVYDPKDVLKIGQTVDVVVVEVNPQTQKIALSMRQLNDDPLKKYKVGAVVKGTIKRLMDFGAFVELEPRIEALLRQSETGLLKEQPIGEHFKVGQEIEAKVIKTDMKERKIDISVRKLDKDRERELVKKYSGKQDRPKLGDILEEDN